MTKNLEEKSTLQTKINTKIHETISPFSLILILQNYTGYVRKHRLFLKFHQVFFIWEKVRTTYTDDALPLQEIIGTQQYLMY